MLNVGDMTWVKCLGVDERGRLNLSRKEAYKEIERRDAAKKAEASEAKPEA